MSTTVERKRTGLTAVLLGLAVIISLFFLTYAFYQKDKAQTLQRELDTCRVEVETLRVQVERSKKNLEDARADKNQKK